MYYLTDTSGGVLAKLTRTEEGIEIKYYDGKVEEFISKPNHQESKEDDSTTPS